MTDDAITVNVITGFLGSGKTTLLQRLLRAPELADTAVLVNEFGEVGLDHILLERVDETTVLLQSGCLCCTIRGDLSTAIRDLYDRRERGRVPPFRRLVIETTGLADPAPIVATLGAEPTIRRHFRLGNVIAVVDAPNGAANLDSYPESVKQAAVADRLVISKTDIADPAAVAGLRDRLRRLNPTAAQIESGRGGVAPSALLTDDLYDPAGRGAEVRRWLAEEAHRHDDRAPRDVNRHGADIAAFCLSPDEPLDWTAFGVWLTMLLNRHGPNVLRVKGLLHVAGVATPVVVHGVQHVIHPPVHLDAWPDGRARTRLVFITRGLPRGPIAASLAAFNRLAGG
ncbi:MAG: GTP-binding protein [Dongiaceae bacterium]